MKDEQLLRYSRQIMLPQLDLEGQQSLLNSHALIIGLGGLGSPIAMYLAAAGVGELTLVDFDKVDLHNLQRQIAHTEKDIGRLKVDSASDRLLALNHEVIIHTIDHQLADDELLAAAHKADVVIDATDNYNTRFAINQACVQSGTPLISGAAIRLDGQVTVYPNQGGETPCYHCLYAHLPQEAETCSENGVLSPVVGIIGTIQAVEAIKVLAGFGTTLAGRLLIVDAATMEFREVKLRRDPNCPTCGTAKNPVSAVS